MKKLKQDGILKTTQTEQRDDLTIVLYASDHGFGHAARNIPIVQAWLNNESVKTVIVKTGVAHGDFMKDVIGPHKKLTFESRPTRYWTCLKA